VKARVVAIVLLAVKAGEWTNVEIQLRRKP